MNAPLAPAKDGALTVEDLLTRAEITDLVLRYATGIDARDWALYRSIFADEVDFDFSTWGRPPARRTADDWVAGVREALSGFDATEHLLSNFVITSQGDEATCVCYLVALHHLVEDGQRQMQSLGGYYTHRLKRGAEGWKIHACTLTVTWTLGDRALFERANARWRRRSGG